MLCCGSLYLKASLQSGYVGNHRLKREANNQKHLHLYLVSLVRCLQHTQVSPGCVNTTAPTLRHGQYCYSRHHHCKLYYNNKTSSNWDKFTLATDQVPHWWRYWYQTFCCADTGPGDHRDHCAMFGLFTVPVCGQTNHKYRHIHNARHLNSNYWNNVLIKSQWSMFTVIISPFCADDSEKYFVHCLKSPPIPIYIYGGGEYGPAVAWLWCIFVTFAVRDTNMPSWRGARVTCHVVTSRDIIIIQSIMLVTGEHRGRGTLVTAKW